jgi:hypothetical protein
VTRIGTAAAELGIPAPKNFGDVPYSFRYRAALPDSIKAKSPEGATWVIRSVGRSRYKFVASVIQEIVPNPLLTVTKVPDSTPGLVAKYSKGDEQALLVRLRYNRLLDVFTGQVQKLVTGYDTTLALREGPPKQVLKATIMHFTTKLVEEVTVPEKYFLGIDFERWKRFDRSPGHLSA